MTFFRVSIALCKHSGKLEEFSTVMQTLDCVSGLHNCREFSQLPLVFRWDYGNTENVLYCLNKNRKFRLEIAMVEFIPPQSFRKRWNPQTYSCFPVPTEMTGKFLYNCKLQLDPVHFGLFSRLLTPQMQPPFCFVIVFFQPREIRAWRNATPGKSCTITSVHSNRIIRANG